ncbi:MAG: 30S ribosomal protein S8 [Verrucomicrobiae bacterium]|nr:30S ribosomal protein S8 [Verrucomicrobiae bacterium]
MVTDPIADFLTQIRNGVMAGKAEIVAPYSRIKSDIAHILKEEGYVRGAELVRKEGKQWLRVELKSGGARRSIEGIRRVSRPGLRRYVGAKDMPRVLGGLGTAVISTPKGVMTGSEARKQNVGGEVICLVW